MAAASSSSFSPFWVRDNRFPFTNKKNFKEDIDAAKKDIRFQTAFWKKLFLELFAT